MIFKSEVLKRLSQGGKVEFLLTGRHLWQTMLREDRPVEVEENEKIEKKHGERKRITDKENQQLQETSKHLMT